MKVRVLAFGIAKDIIGGLMVDVDLPDQVTTGNLKQLHH